MSIIYSTCVTHDIFRSIISNCGIETIKPILNILLFKIAINIVKLVFNSVLYHSRVFTCMYPSILLKLVFNGVLYQRRVFICTQVYICSWDTTLFIQKKLLYEDILHPHNTLLHSLWPISHLYVITKTLHYDCIKLHSESQVSFWCSKMLLHLTIYKHILNVFLFNIAN